MEKTAELNFTKKLIEKYHIGFNSFSACADESAVLDMGFRKLINPDIDYNFIKQQLVFKIKQNILYKIEDTFDFNYLCFLLPDTEPSKYIIIGPYCTREIDLTRINELIKFHNLSSMLVYELEKFYQSVTYVDNESNIIGIITVLCESIWGGMDSFSLENIQGFYDSDQTLVTDKNSTNRQADTHVTTELLEKRYELERTFMKAVSNGQAHKAELLLMNLSAGQMEKRSVNPLRNFQNYSIIMNTLLRKAVEDGGVHPVYIDALSSRFAKKIEMASSLPDISKLQKEMITKYCQAVRSHSLKGYSQIVRKVITRINTDISSDLSLSKQAEHLNVNPSYLSSIFKKETGQTLTDYVNSKRMEYASYLLNSTNLQVQAIAQQCGIPDVNYFTKTFKRYIGFTPREFREKNKI